MISNSQALDFMNRLVVDQGGKNGLCLSEWETQFLSSFSQAYRGWAWFTEGRVKSVDRMWRKYGAELNFPHPLDTVAERPRLADAEPDCCQYIIRESGQQQRCNEPATCREPGRLRYCDVHGQAVQEDCKRAGIKIALINYP
jgi:hypothetical protein